MFKSLATVSFLLFAASGAVLAEDIVIQGAPVAPFKIYSSDPDTPPAPTNLNATADDSGVWTVTWDAAVDENDDPVAVDNYIVYYWVAGVDGGWEHIIVDGSSTDRGIGALGGPSVVTVISVIDQDTSEAWEYVVLGGPPQIFPCPLTRLRLQPPPPGAILYPECLN